ncbi:cell division topological specificity factor MinE [Candidatus Schmidhempelia bombi]|jgi:cell division topological specificity factor|uniref:Cell division topological specificity factor n=1 Tax=Candidatus Schmidhempelia bombi str. Bimp TaxID=1387197 RepID=A0AB94IDT9_9GAMM|nr:cell division topological specificity factor MinE [Candidatus Schmidhempelia bombi]TEA27631.1 cell division topological specificity factor MinE [Candidatus Schmidhempelia bombi str. Bimp]
MALLDVFLSPKKSTANIAKERLQIIVAERRRYDSEPSYLPELRRDLLNVISKYIKVDPSTMSLQFEQKSDDITVLELNVTLPDDEIEYKP